MNNPLIRQFRAVLILLTLEHLICAGQRPNYTAGGTF